MKQSVVRATLAGVVATLLVAAPQAYAKGKPPPPPPPSTPDNVDEWKLINLQGTDSNGSYDYRTSVNPSGIMVHLFDGRTDCRHVALTGPCQNHTSSGR